MGKIPEIIDNRNYFLKDALNQNIRYSKVFKVAAGYFYLGGFDLIKDNIPEDCKIKIIIGDESDLTTVSEIQKGYLKRKEATIDSLNRDLLNLSEEEKAKIVELSELIQSGNIDIRIYVKDKFHSKAYIFHRIIDEEQQDSAIVGSSNFSNNGLGKSEISNTELNIYITQVSMVSGVETWFDNIWDDSQEFREELMKIIDKKVKVEKLDITPFHIILKTLSTYFDSIKNLAKLEKDDLRGLMEFQKYAVTRAIDILSIYNGVIISDSVGLGKTYIAKGLLRYYSKLGSNILIICPAALKDMWSRETADIMEKIKIITQETVGRNGFNDYDVRGKMILIDEAHNFRNEYSNRFKELINIAEGKKIIELTATPINNSIIDLYNLISIFTRDHEFKDNLGILSIKDSFFNYKNKKTDVESILDELLIRRSRNFIRKKYKNNKDSNFEMKFPKRHLKQINYEITEVYGKLLFKYISNLIQNLHLPIISKVKMTIEQNNYTKALIRTMLLKRFESSIEAFNISIEKQVKYYKELLKSMEHGYLLCKKSFMEDLQNRCIQYDVLDKIKFDEFEGDIEILSQNIKDDLNNLEELLSKVKKLKSRGDVKLDILKKYLSRDLKGEKILIFTQFKDTARYIYKHLSNLDLKIEEMDGAKFNNNQKANIIQRFAPKANKANIRPEDELDILIATDMISEGQNLQDCNIIINYDLTWNPVKLIQREGRIDRINTEFDDIYIYNFIPDSKLDEILNLMGRLTEKIKGINDVVGNESKIISEDEILKEKIFNDRDIEYIKKINQEDAFVMEKIEEENEGIINSKEGMLEDYLSLIYNKDNNSKEAEVLENGIYTIRKSQDYKGVYMYYKIGFKNYLLFYDMNTNSIIYDKNTVYNIISQGNFLKSKPIKRKIQFNIEDILNKGKEYVQHNIKSLVQKQETNSSIDRIQKKVGKRISNILTSNELNLSEAEIELLKRINNPLHKGILQRLRNINMDKSDKELVVELLDILVVVENKKWDKVEMLREDILLVCYEIFV